MAIVLVGPSCSGKSALARALKEELGYKVYQGRDYLNLGRNEQEAWSQFTEMLCDGEKGIIYVIGNVEKYKLLKQIACTRIFKINAPIAFMKDRLRAKLDMEELPDEFMAKLEEDIENWKDCDEPHTFFMNNSDCIDVIVKSIMEIIAAQ